MSSILGLERKQKNYSNPFRILTFLFLSYSFGIETINTFIDSRSSLKNHTRFQTKMGKVWPVFRPQRRKTPTRWGGTCLYSLYKGVPPPGNSLDYLRRYCTSVNCIPRPTTIHSLSCKGYIERSILCHAKPCIDWGPNSFGAIANFYVYALQSELLTKVKLKRSCSVTCCALSAFRITGESI